MCSGGCPPARQCACRGTTRRQTTLCLLFLYFCFSIYLLFSSRWHPDRSNLTTRAIIFQDTRQCVSTHAVLSLRVRCVCPSSTKRTMSHFGYISKKTEYPSSLRSRPMATFSACLFDLPRGCSVFRVAPVVNGTVTLLDKRRFGANSRTSPSPSSDVLVCARRWPSIRRAPAPRHVRRYYHSLNVHLLRILDTSIARC